MNDEGIEPMYMYCPRCGERVIVRSFKKKVVSEGFLGAEDDNHEKRMNTYTTVECKARIFCDFCKHCTWIQWKG